MGQEIDWIGIDWTGLNWGDNKVRIAEGGGGRKPIYKIPPCRSQRAWMLGFHEL